MRKLCDKHCEDCEIEECLLKRPPWDWRPAERTRSEQSKQARRSYQAKKRELCVAFGVCRECMCRDATYGKKCLECHVKEHKRNEARRDGIHRSERTAYGLCFFCGKPVEKGFRTCPEHHKIVASNILHTDYSNNKNHIWRKRDKLIFTRKK